MSAIEILRDASTFEAVDDGWTVYGRAVRFDTRTRVSDDGREWYWEEFAPDSFNRDVDKGARWVNLMVGHRGDDGDRFLGRLVVVDGKPDGLWTGFRLNRDHPLAEQARYGELTKWSVGARVYRTDIAADGTRRRMRCGLNHVAATTSPQYEGTGVLTVRDSHIETHTATPRLDEWRRRMGRG